MRQGSTTSTNLDCLQCKRNVTKLRQKGKKKLTQLSAVRKLLTAPLRPLLVHQGSPSSSDTYQENQKEAVLDEEVSACKHRRGTTY